MLYVGGYLLMEALKANDLARGPIRRAYETHRLAIDRVVVQANQFAAIAEASATSQLKIGWWILGGTMVGVNDTGI